MVARGTRSRVEWDRWAAAHLPKGLRRSSMKRRPAGALTSATRAGRRALRCLQRATGAARSRLPRADSVLGRAPCWRGVPRLPHAHALKPIGKRQTRAPALLQGRGGGRRRGGGGGGARAPHSHRYDTAPALVALQSPVVRGGPPAPLLRPSGMADGPSCSAVAHATTACCCAPAWQATAGANKPSR